VRLNDFGTWAGVLLRSHFFACHVEWVSANSLVRVLGGEEHFLEQETRRLKPNVDQSALVFCLVGSFSPSCRPQPRRECFPRPVSTRFLYWLQTSFERGTAHEKENSKTANATRSPLALPSLRLSFIFFGLRVQLFPPIFQRVSSLVTSMKIVSSQIVELFLFARDRAHESNRIRPSTFPTDLDSLLPSPYFPSSPLLASSLSRFKAA